MKGYVLKGKVTNSKRRRNVAARFITGNHILEHNNTNIYIDFLGLYSLKERRAKLKLRFILLYKIVNNQQPLYN